MERENMDTNNWVNFDKPAGERKEPQSGPTPGGNNIQIEISEREDQDLW